MNMMSNVSYYFDIVDISGKMVSERYILSAAENRIDLGYLDNGLYIGRFYKGNQLVRTNKIIIAK